VGTGIALTPAGEVLLREAKLILGRVENLKAKLGSASTTNPKASLRIGGSYSPSAVLLPSVLARFKKDHPDIDLQLRTDNRLTIERMILKGEIDLAVLHNPASNRLLIMEPYRAEPLIAFVAPDHPLARKKRLTLEDVREVSFVIRKPLAGSGTGKTYLQKLRKQGFTTKVAMQCDSPEALKMAVTRRMGVGILYKDVIADSIKRGEFRALTLPSDASDGRSFIVYHKTRPLSEHALEFLKLLRTYRDEYD
jgi:DNA-binding transcriptional LysR family regulator